MPNGRSSSSSSSAPPPLNPVLEFCGEDSIFDVRSLCVSCGKDAEFVVCSSIGQVMAASCRLRTRTAAVRATGEQTRTGVPEPPPTWWCCIRSRLGDRDRMPCEEEAGPKMAHSGQPASQCWPVVVDVVVKMYDVPEARAIGAAFQRIVSTWLQRLAEDIGS